MSLNPMHCQRQLYAVRTSPATLLLLFYFKLVAVVNIFFWSVIWMDELMDRWMDG
jgi:hypothetical protein